MGDAVPAVSVAPWGTRTQPEQDPTAPLHDCLWEIAMEQAILERMKAHQESWSVASSKVTEKDIRKHLDKVCDDNGFRRLDGSGSGRDPNLIADGEHIKVTINPTDYSRKADGLPGRDSKALSKYNETIAGAGPTGEPDLTKKMDLDKYLGTIKNFGELSDETQTAIIEGYQRLKDTDRPKLAQLVNSDAFRNLPAAQQKTVLDIYGKAGHEAATAAIDKAVTLNPVPLAPGVPEKLLGQLLAVIATPGFGHLSPDQQTQFLQKYASDPAFHAAVDRIVTDKKFTDLLAQEQAHALDILRRYSGRKGSGYGEIKAENRTAVLVELWSSVLSKPEFKLNELGSDGKETAAQTPKINSFADNKAPGIKNG